MELMAIESQHPHIQHRVSSIEHRISSTLLYCC